jgi:hypothetical protein
MTSTINALSTGSGGIIQTADASGVLALQTNGTTAVTISTGQVVTFAQAPSLPAASIPQAALAANVAGNGPAFRANTVTAQSIGSSTFTKIQFNVEEFDTNSNYDPTTNYRFTPTVAGYYQVNANVSLGGGTIGYVQCVLYKTGAAFCSGSSVANNNTVGGMLMASTVMYLNGSTDYVEFYLWQNQGTAISLQTSTGNNTFSASMVRSA